jgi:hypothetical protein
MAPPPQFFNCLYRFSFCFISLPQKSDYIGPLYRGEGGCKQAGPRDIVWEKTETLKAWGNGGPFINISLLLFYFLLIFLPVQSNWSVPVPSSKT